MVLIMSLNSKQQMCECEYEWKYSKFTSSTIRRQGSADSHHSGGAASLQSNGSNGSGDANKSKTWSKKQQV